MDGPSSTPQPKANGCALARLHEYPSDLGFTWQHKTFSHMTYTVWPLFHRGAGCGFHLPTYSMFVQQGRPHTATETSLSPHSIHGKVLRHLNSFTFEARTAAENIFALVRFPLNIVIMRFSCSSSSATILSFIVM